MPSWKKLWVAGAKAVDHDRTKMIGVDFGLHTMMICDKVSDIPEGMHRYRIFFQDEQRCDDFYSDDISEVVSQAREMKGRFSLKIFQGQWITIGEERRREKRSGLTVSHSGR